MKKALSSIAIILACMLTLTGCANKSPNDQLRDDLDALYLMGAFEDEEGAK